METRTQEHASDQLALASGEESEPRQKRPEVSLLDVAILLIERKRMIVWIVVTCTTIAIALSLLAPKKYTATVTILAPQQNASLGSTLATQLGNLGGIAGLAGTGLGLKNPNDLVVGMLRGRTVEEAMISRFGLMAEYHAHNLEDARRGFEQRSDVDGSAKDGMIHIAFEARNPERAAELANGYVDELKKLTQHLAITEASQRRLFFEQQLLQAKDSLADAEEALKQTEQKTGVIELTGQAHVLIESAASLRAQIAAKEVEIQAMQTYATSQNPELVQAQRELAGLREQLSKLGGSDEISGGFLVPKGKVPEAGLEYVRGLREVKYRETIFEILAKQFELAKLDEAKEGAVIQVVDVAVPPSKRSSPKRTLMVLGATVIGWLIGIFAALSSAGWDYLMSEPESRSKLIHLKRMLPWKANRQRLREAP
jgi:tyrosine-protein kinase Etk/Wzc